MFSLTLFFFFFLRNLVLHISDLFTNASINIQNRNHFDLVAICDTTLFVLKMTVWGSGEQKIFLYDFRDS